MPTLASGIIMQMKRAEIKTENYININSEITTSLDFFGCGSRSAV
jgi:hypothetical protein